MAKMAEAGGLGSAGASRVRKKNVFNLFGETTGGINIQQELADTAAATKVKRAL
jgi:hypothetical protein